MAKKAMKKVNKTQAVKEYMSQNRKASPKEVSEALTKQGIEVSPNYVSTIKSKLKKRRRRPRKVGAAAASPTDRLSLSALLDAKRFAERIGNLDKAKELLDALAKLK